MRTMTTRDNAPMIITMVTTITNTLASSQVRGFPNRF